MVAVVVVVLLIKYTHITTTILLCDVSSVLAAIIPLLYSVSAQLQEIQGELSLAKRVRRGFRPIYSMFDGPAEILEMQ